MNVNQDEYVRGAEGTAGISLLIHPQRSMPFPEDEGMTISPGHSTSIGLSKVSIPSESGLGGEFCNMFCITISLSDVVAL